MSLVVNPYAYFTDTNGDALNGYLYIGEANKNAENYPIAIYYDALFTIPAPNPLTISAGYIYNGGTIAQIYAAVDYSIIVKKTDGSLVYSSPSDTSKTNIETSIHSASSKTTPVDNDEIGILDSANSFSLNKLTWANLKTTLTTYFNTLYATISNLDLKANIASPALTGTPTAPTASVETNTTQIATTAFVKAKSEADSIGVGQTWQDVTANRALGVTYTNTTGKPIEIAVICYNGATNSTLDMRVIVDGVQRLINYTGPVNYPNSSSSIIVPNNSTYSVTGGTMLRWSELR